MILSSRLYSTTYSSYLIFVLLSVFLLLTGSYCYSQDRKIGTVSKEGLVSFSSPYNGPNGTIRYKYRGEGKYMTVGQLGDWLWLNIFIKEYTITGYMWHGKLYTDKELGPGSLSQCKFETLRMIADVQLLNQSLGRVTFNPVYAGNDFNIQRGFVVLRSPETKDRFDNMLNSLTISNIECFAPLYSNFDQGIEKIKKIEEAAKGKVTQSVQNNSKSNSATIGSASITTNTSNVNNSTSKTGDDDFWNSSSSSKSTTSASNASTAAKTTSTGTKSNSQTSGVSTANQNVAAQRLQQQQEAEMKRANEIAEQKRLAQQEQKRREEEARQNALKRAEQTRLKVDAINQRTEQDVQQIQQFTQEFNATLTNIFIARYAESQRQEELDRIEREKKEQQRLEEQRIAKEFREAERNEALRIALLDEGYNAIPQLTKPSAYNNELKEVYYFYIIRTGQEELILTNTFPVRILSDNTWPYKSDIDNKLKSAGGYSDAKLIGYYSSSEEANKKRGEYINLLSNKGFLLSNTKFIYKDYGAPANQPKAAKPKTTTSDDFWKK